MNKKKLIYEELLLFNCFRMMKKIKKISAVYLWISLVYVAKLAHILS